MQYRQSLYWERDAIEDNDVDAAANDAATWGKLAELDWSDVSSVVEFVVDKAENGFRVRSEIPRLDAAISFSRALYTFEDVEQLDLDDALENKSDDEDGADAVMGNFDMHAALAANKCTPSLPSTLDISLSISAKDRMPLRDAILVPLLQHMANVSYRQEGDACVEQLHADAFRVVTEVLTSNHHSEIRVPNKIRWNDVRVLYVLERIEIATVRDEAGDDGGAALPFEVLDPSSYLYAVESLSYEDFSLDNEIQGKNEREFIEEVTSRHPGSTETAQVEAKKAQPKQQLPIDEHEHEILEAVRTQRVTIIHCETVSGWFDKFLWLNRFLLFFSHICEHILFHLYMYIIYTWCPTHRPGLRQILPSSNHGSSVTASRTDRQGTRSENVHHSTSSDRSQESH